jgi:hypothetical protein
MYQDTYAEQILGKQITKVDIIQRNALLAVAIFFGFCALFVSAPIGLPLFAVFLVLYLWKDTVNRTEYEYLFVSGTFQVDRVRRASSRKQVLEAEMSEILTLSPAGSRKVLAYDHGHMEVRKYLSGDPEAKQYVMILQQKNSNRRLKVILEPDEQMLEAMHAAAPERVTAPQ